MGRASGPCSEHDRLPPETLTPRIPDPVANLPAGDANCALWAAVRAFARDSGRDPPDRIGIDFPGGLGLLMLAQAGIDQVIDWSHPLPRPAGSLWVFEGKWVYYAGAGEPFELHGQHRQLLEVLAGTGGRAITDDAILHKTTIPSAERLRKVASELRETLRHQLDLAANPVARDGGGYRLTVS